MATTIDAARVLIVQQLSALTGLSVVLEAADPVRVATPYLVVGQAVSNEPNGYPRVAHVPGVSLSMVLGYEARIPIAAHGTAALPWVARYFGRALVPSDSLGAALRAAGVWPFRWTGPRQVSTPYQTGHEPRVLGDLFVRYDLDVTGASGVDEAAGIVVDLSETGGGTTIDLDAAITIPEE